MRKVKTKWSINLPSGSTPRVKAGDFVVAGQTIAEDDLSKEVVVSLVTALKGWSDKDVQLLEKNLIGKEIVAGKVMYETGGFFSKKIAAPGSGTIVKFDEFNNLYLKLPLSRKEVIESPIEAKVLSVGVDGLVLEFRADEYEGVGLNDGRAWGINGLKWVDSLGNLSFEDEGRVIVMDKLLPEVIAKAEVVGVRGVVVIGKMEIDGEHKAGFKMPIINLPEATRNGLMADDNLGRRVLLNAGSGRLLLVI